MRNAIVTMYGRKPAGAKSVITQLELSESVARDVCSSAIAYAHSSVEDPHDSPQIVAILVQIEEPGNPEFVNAYIWKYGRGWTKQY